MKHINFKKIRKKELPKIILFNYCLREGINLYLFVEDATDRHSKRLAFALIN